MQCIYAMCKCCSEHLEQALLHSRGTEGMPGPVLVLDCCHRQDPNATAAFSLTCLQQPLQNACMTMSCC